MVTVRTDQRMTTGTLPVAFPVAFGSDNLDGTLDDAPHLGQGLANHTFDIYKRLGRLHAIISDPFEPVDPPPIAPARQTAFAWAASSP